MNWFTTRLRKFTSQEDGATMVEYGLMVAVIAVVVIVGASLLGENVSTLFNDMATEVAGT